MYDLELTIRQNCRFSYLSVSDLCLVIQRLLHTEKPKFLDYNVVPEKSISLLEIAHMVNEIAGKNLPIRIFKDGYNKEYSANGQRLHKEFSFSFRDYKSGISELYQWYEEHKNQIDLAILKDTR